MNAASGSTSPTPKAKGATLPERVSEKSREEGPPKGSDQIERKMSSMMALMQMSSGPVPQQILEKIEPKHIDKVLEITDQQNRYVHEDKMHHKIYSVVCLLVFVGLVLAIILLLKDNPALLTTVITNLVLLVGGFGAG